MPYIEAYLCRFCDCVITECECYNKTNPYRVTIYVTKEEFDKIREGK